MDGVDLIQIPEEFKGVIDIAHGRIAGIMQAWARGGNFDPGFLLRSVYLQGLKDGAQVEGGTQYDVPRKRRRTIRRA